MKVNLAKTLITGSGGMVGSYVDFGIRMDRRGMDVTDLKEVRAVCQKYKPEAIIHLAAETDVDRCERDPEYAYLINSVGTFNVATVAKEIGAKMVYISTAGVFDGLKNTSYTEKDKPNPQNFYGRSKYFGELAVQGILDDYIITRVCWMFGGGPKKDQKFVAKIIEQFPKGELRVVTDQIGSPTFGKDLIEGIKKLLQKDAKGIYNLANSGVCSRYEFAKEIAHLLKSKVKINPITMKDFKMDAFRTYNEGMISQLKTQRNWKVALEEYLKTEWQEYGKV